MRDIHDVWHGDSRELVKKFKPGRVDCLITDPPFGVDNLSNRATTEAGKSYTRRIEGDDSPENALALFEEVFRNLHPGLSDTADVYIFTSYQVLELWIRRCDALLCEYGYTRKAVLVWDKGDPGVGDLNSPWGMGMEFILFYQRGRVRSIKRSNSVLHSPRIPPGKLIHPHEKPIALLNRLIKASTEVGEFIVDPFAGSGSLVRAAKACGRNAIGIEYDKRNYEMAQRALADQGDSLF